MGRTLVEVCVEDVPSALAAEAGGADRVELCAVMAVGGVTPGAGAIGLACERLAIPVHALVRPRGGGFVYDDAEFEVMNRDITTARELGAAGIVLGLLTPDGRIDRDRTASLVERARPLSVTFHKAFDAARDPFEALRTLIDLGIDRVLTSGRAPTAREGLDLLAQLDRESSGRLVIMAGGGITTADLPALLAAGLREVHVGSSVTVPTDEGVSVTHAEKVRDLVQRLG